jgi:hypothetical protein
MISGLLPAWTFADAERDALEESDGRAAVNWDRKQTWNGGRGGDD